MGCYLTDSQLLYLSDILVTNTGNHGVDFAGSGKPMYCYHVKENGFMRYMKEYYPGLCLTSLEELEDPDSLRRKSKKSQEAFQKQTVIDSEKNPFEEINRLFA